MSLVTKIDVSCRAIQWILDGGGGEELAGDIRHAIMETRKQHPELNPARIVVQIHWKTDEQSAEQSAN